MEVTPEIRERLAKVYELVKRGGTEGEQAAAKTALDRMLKKYKLDGINLDALDLLKYSFKYSTEMEMWLIGRLVKTFLTDNQMQGATRTTYKVRQVNLLLKYVDYITIDCAYEYFRRHMKQQWLMFCAPELARKRKAKTRNKRRKELQNVFFNDYAIKSNLYRKEEIIQISPADLTEQELADSRKLSNVSGGVYNKQVITGNLLEAANNVSAKPLSNTTQYSINF